jgi:hypothetical protein
MDPSDCEAFLKFMAHAAQFWKRGGDGEIAITFQRAR